MLAQFYYSPVQVGVDETGVANYEDRIFVKINRDATLTVNREADEEDYERFPAEYKYFQKSVAKYEPLASGLPLEMWPIASPADVMNLKGHDIRTVQQLATQRIEKVPLAIGELIKYAQDYLRIAGEAALATKAISELRTTNAELKEQLLSARGEVNTLRKMMEKAA